MSSNENTYPVIYFETGFCIVVTIKEIIVIDYCLYGKEGMKKETIMTSLLTFLKISQLCNVTKILSLLNWSRRMRNYVTSFSLEESKESGGILGGDGLSLVTFDFSVLGNGAWTRIGIVHSPRSLSSISSGCSYRLQSTSRVVVTNSILKIHCKEM